MDEAGRMLDSLQLNLRPRLFRKLHHHIAKVTGMTQSQLDAGVPIKEGLRRFMDWCGPDAAFGRMGHGRRAGAQAEPVPERAG